MNNMSTQELEVALLETVLYDEKTGELHSVDERVQHLDAIRLKILKIGEMFDDMDEMSMHLRVALFETFIRVTHTYLGIVEKHEEFLDAGR